MGIYSESAKLKVLNEVYFGYTSDMEELEHLIHNARVNCRSTYDKNMNNGKDILAINRAIEKIFGFNTVAFMVLPMGSANAFTLPIGSVFTNGVNRMALGKKKDGFYFNKDSRYDCIICVTSYLWANPDISDRECLAILMHEIGHNFQSAMSNMGVVFDNFTKVIKLISLLSSGAVNLGDILNIPFLRHGIVKANNNMMANKDQEQLFTDVFSIISKVMSVFGFLVKVSSLVIILNPITNILATIGMTLFGAIKKIHPLYLISDLGGEYGERTADNFATAYGLGAELGSALSKMEANPNAFDKAVNNVPILGAYYNFMAMPLVYIAGLFDAHPYTESRICAQMKYITKELNKAGLDPKMKKALTENLKEFDKVIDEQYKNFEGSEGLKFKRSVSAGLIAKGGGDPRKFWRANNRDFDDSYNYANHESASLTDVLEQVKLI